MNLGANKQSVHKSTQQRIIQLKIAIVPSGRNPNIYHFGCLQTILRELLLLKVKTIQTASHQLNHLIKESNLVIYNLMETTE